MAQMSAYMISVAYATSAVWTVADVKEKSSILSQQESALPE
jgi:hypothetical protein